VANFAALERLQSKAEFVRLLTELNLPHPPTVIARSGRDLKHACAFPCYIKLAYSTAGRGVFLVHNAAERDAVANCLEAEGRLTDDSEILVQRPAPGLLSVVQTVFQHGRLVAGHCYQARAMGVGGSARARISVSHPLVLQHLADIGARLNWHGALMIDYLWDPASAQPAYIDANPRIGETFNATLSGVNLCAVLAQVALNQPLTPLAPGRAGTRTHSILMMLLAGAQQGQSRLALGAELARGLSHQGIYAGSAEELTRPRDDLLSLVPALWITGRVLIDPRAAERLVNKTVHNYALSEKAAQAIRRLGTPREETCGSSKKQAGA
jgi:predicted ATP-grasp superfamily ATP-dependent carboligase